MSFDDMDSNNDLEPRDTPPREESGNRTFLVAAGILGAITVLALLFIALYALVLLPRQQATREQQLQDLNAQNTAVAMAITQTSAAMTAPTLTPTQPVANTATATPTSVVVVATSTSSGPDPRTATVAALLTQAAVTTQTVVPTATALPNTGFADDVGLPAMLGLAVLLIAVIFIARRLRTA
ncbi:MAG TPA: LPXTG cell wall anchor domain-containing protein [Anaerolineales bacterium]|nr:LPXTG cell wall anchor domain-containing protein [Anaerolineales bacterium]